LEDPGVDGSIILTWIFRKWDMGVWFGLGWLRIERCGGHIFLGKENFWFNKNVGNFLSSCKLVSFSGRTVFRGVCMEVADGIENCIACDWLLKVL
jgi:hypothetical protein